MVHNQGEFLKKITIDLKAGFSINLKRMKDVHYSFRMASTGLMMAALME